MINDGEVDIKDLEMYEFSNKIKAQGFNKYKNFRGLIPSNFMNSESKVQESKIQKIHPKTVNL